MTRALVLPAVAAAIGFACGSAARKQLAPAGTPRDDGSGVLARASANLYTRVGAPDAARAAAGYGGARYGGARYGGGRYANYEFEPSAGSNSDLPSYEGDYVVDKRLPTGTITGRLSWTRRPSHDEVTGTGACESAQPSAAAPRHAIVFVRGVARGRGFPELPGSPTRRWQIGGLVRLLRCRLAPYAQVVGPIGALLTIRSESGSKRRLFGFDTRGAAVIDVAFASAGEEQTKELSGAGTIELIDDRGVRGWVVVAGHPHYTTVDGDGRFRLTEVPAGTWELVAWHPPMPVGAELSEPIEVTRRVTVRSGRTATISLSLNPPREPRSLPAAAPRRRRLRRPPRTP